MEGLAYGGAVIRSFDDLIATMDAHLRRFEGVSDNRAAFLRVYRHMTGSVRDRCGQDFFLDRQWIEQVAIHFAQWYFRALDAFEAGDRSPPAWNFAFDSAVRRRCFVLQDVLLGMNAHINNDLPQVVAEILAAEGRLPPEDLARRRFDHDQINRVLELVIPSVETELAHREARMIGPLNRVMGTLDRSLAAYGLKNWRDTVWRNAQFLLTTRSAPERERVVRFIEADALAVSQQIDTFAPLAWFRPLAPLARRLKLC